MACCCAVFKALKLTHVRLLEAPIRAVVQVHVCEATEGGVLLSLTGREEIEEAPVHSVAFVVAA